MPRTPREVPGGIVYHVLNRAVARLAIFEADADYAAFVRVIRQAVERQDRLAKEKKAKRVDVLAWCLMPNHWHLVLRPKGDGDLSTFMRWLTMTHTQRWHAHRRSAGSGPLYQGRFKSFPVDDRGDHLETVVAYVEQNPRRAGLVEQAAAWPWSSLGRRGQDENEEKGPALLPVARWPGGHAWDEASWKKRVGRESDAEVERELAVSLKRGRPFGRDAWTRRIVGRLNLDSTLRPRGRPRVLRPSQTPAAGARR